MLKTTSLLCATLLGVALPTASCALGEGTLEEVDPESIPAVVTWDDHVAPLMERYCAGCHSDDVAVPAAGIAYDSREQTACDFEEIEEVIFEHGSMPPGGARRLDGWDRAVLLRWADQGFPRAVDAAGAIVPSALDCHDVRREDDDLRGAP